LTPGADDARWMRAALTLARRGLGRSAPNPAVGCVIVNDGRLVGRGWTQPGGRPHAERMALDMAGAAARGGTAYVTFEPCAHHGRTPPCAEALVAAGVARVVAPMEDPDPRVSGKGFEALIADGIVVDTGLMAAEAAALNVGFLTLHARGRPHVTLKLAATLDGRIATASGESRWITGPAARLRVHLMRAEADAVLIGAGTARADDPTLDVRIAGLEAASPLRVVMDGGLSIPLTGRLAQTAANIPTLIFHHEDADAGRIAALHQCGVATEALTADANGALDPVVLMRALGARGITRVLCEGGGRLAATLLTADLIDEIAWFTAGAAIGGDGAPAIGAFGLSRLAEAPRFARVSVTSVGADVLSVWRR
jgi:diaminohydroxyphosphoribosylaminopyrimidine deaminase/5-amino-6-(5-phosphoribosylamino)uracil reductase